MASAETARRIPIPAYHPVTRQILALIGNRYVVFGSQSRLPGSTLGPVDVVIPDLTRIGDEYEFSPDRLVKSIQVQGAAVTEVTGPDLGWDIEVQYPDHQKLLVGIKIRTRDLTRGELEKNSAWIDAIQQGGEGSPEVWNFNIERLRLTILTKGVLAPDFVELDPLDVWEFNEDKTVFNRDYVWERVGDWQKRVNNLYENVRAWSTEQSLQCETARSVVMAEEMMQRFAVPDQNMPVLDVSKKGKYILSFVPAGLWIFGSNGRINAIGRSETTPLLDLSRKDETDWNVLASRNPLTFEKWGRDAFFRLIADARLHE